MIPAIDQHAANAHLAQLAEGDFFAGSHERSFSQSEFLAKHDVLPAETDRASVMIGKIPKTRKSDIIRPEQPLVVVISNLARLTFGEDITAADEGPQRRRAALSLPRRQTWRKEFLRDR